MFAWGAATRIHLAAGATDLRKGFDGLYALLQQRLELDSLSGHVFLFRRPRRQSFGEPAQMDGSFFVWLEGRGRRDCWLGMVDDPTGQTPGRLGEEETTWPAADVLRA